MRKKSILMVLALLMVIASAGTSIAYFTSRDKASNVYTIGSVNITLAEPSWNPNEDHPLVAGATYKKDPTITNTGTTGAYVRMRVKFSDYAAYKNASGNAEPTEMLGTLGEGWTLVSGPEVQDDEATFLYGYRDVLQPNASTNPLFSQVTVPPFADSDFGTAVQDDFDITVSAEAIQSDSFDNYEAAFAAFDQYAGN